MTLHSTNGLIYWITKESITFNWIKIITTLKPKHQWHRGICRHIISHPCVFFLIAFAQLSSKRNKKNTFKNARRSGDQCNDDFHTFFNFVDISIFLSYHNIMARGKTGGKFFHRRHFWIPTTRASLQKCLARDEVLKLLDINQTSTTYGNRSEFYRESQTSGLQ